MGKACSLLQWNQMFESTNKEQLASFVANVLPCVGFGRAKWGRKKLRSLVCYERNSMRNKRKQTFPTMELENTKIKTERHPTVVGYPLLWFCCLLCCPPFFLRIVLLLFLCLWFCNCWQGFTTNKFSRQGMQCSFFWCGVKMCHPTSTMQFWSQKCLYHQGFLGRRENS